MLPDACMKNPLKKNCLDAHPPRKAVIVLPAFNEAPTLAKLLSHIGESMDDAHLRYHVVIVDDGSSDATSDIAQRFSVNMPMTIVRHSVNQGLGATIRDGLVTAMKLAADHDTVITMDADDTHSPGLILRMVEMAREGFDVVIASRYQKGSRVIGVPLHRRFLSRIASLLFRFILPIKGVKDYTCGYRAYRADAIRRVLSVYGDEFLARDGFECMIDILLKLGKMGFIIGEASFILRYDQKDGNTKMNLRRTIYRSLMLLVKRRFGQ
jgi:dolichol-phosphate mannosyltransferase